MSLPSSSLIASPSPSLLAAAYGVRHLYVHVPFCPSICPYCDFHVLTRSSGAVEAYLAQIEREAAYLAQRGYHIELDTVYLGGGTPSFLRDAELSALVGSIRRHLGWGRLENTLEVNPGTVSAARARHWQSLGFDRASVGVQSLDDATLRFLGRQHDAHQARTAVRTLQAQGLRVSGDLITAVAGQPLEADIAGLSELGVGHISAYTLTIEAGTPFARRGVQVSEQDEQKGFGLSAQLLQQAGFERYEVSNYARVGEQLGQQNGQHSRHNLGYWNNHFYLGLGPGAAGHYPPQDTQHTAQRRTNPHLHDWLALDFAAASPLPDTEELGPHDSFTDALFMGLRLQSGVNIARLSRQFEQPLEAIAPVIARYQAMSLLELEGEQLRATPAGWWHLNKLLTELMEA